MAGKMEASFGIKGNIACYAAEARSHE